MEHSHQSDAYFVRPGERLSEAAERVAIDAVYHARDTGGTMHDAGARAAAIVLELIERRDAAVPSRGPSGQPDPGKSGVDHRVQIPPDWLIFEGRLYGLRSEPASVVHRAVHVDRAGVASSADHAGAVEAGWALNDAIIDMLRASSIVPPSQLWEAVETFQDAAPERGRQPDPGKRDGADWRDDPMLAHLRDDAPCVVCSGCGRKSWGGNAAGSRCGMTQPDGFACEGVFGLPVKP